MTNIPTFLACKVNAFIRKDLSKLFSLIHDRYVLLNATDCVLGKFVNYNVTSKEESNASGPVKQGSTNTF